ncbi:MAG TPA: hypothetical protein VKE94_23100 [Gemmataceae bacterium]|nr:hypothetical protein [Gemmataceae bacterium]
MVAIWIGSAGFLVGLVTFVYWQLRKRHLDRWLGTYLLDVRKRSLPRQGEQVHLLLCIADHFEPFYGGVPRERALERVQNWVDTYPRRFTRFRDSDGQPPRHTFFYPAEQYDPEILDALAKLCASGYTEVEIHLHHDGDTAADLRRTLTEFKALLADRHGLLARDRCSGEVRYGFVHGDWALDNSRPDGQCCGVDNELEVLRQTGCYADFTLPSAPSPTQTRTINSIYYARGVPNRRKSHDRGVAAGSAAAPANALLLVQGPLLLDWRRRKWGLLPRLENGCLQGSQPPHVGRVASWLKARVQVPQRPDWYFVKLHAHGGPEDSHATLLGEPMVRFHTELADWATRNPEFHFHYVTARETCNLVHAAEAGWTGSVAEARDYRFLASLSPPARSEVESPRIEPVAVSAFGSG